MSKAMKVHYQPDVPDYCGDGNFEPIACGLEEVGHLTHRKGSTTCKNCLRCFGKSKAHKHRWATDGHHMNEFCAVCFEDSPRWERHVAKRKRGAKR